MTQFLEAILAFPTIFFTVLFGIVMGYWLTVIIGAVGIDLLDGDFGAGALEGGAKAAVEGGVKAAFEGGAKAALEGGAKAALEGGAKAAMEGGAKAAMEGGAKASMEGGAKASASFIEILGLGGVPVTVSLSFLIFFSWLLSLAITQPAKEALGVLPGALLSAGVGMLSLAAGTVAAGFAVRPLRPMFAIQQAPRRASMLGRVCTINSGRVDGQFGHATLEDGGAGLILNVVCDKANELTRGSQAVLLNYDSARDAYEVEPVDWLLPEELQHLGNPDSAAALAREKARTR